MTLGYYIRWEQFLLKVTKSSKSSQRNTKNKNLKVNLQYLNKQIHLLSKLKKKREKMKQIKQNSIFSNQLKGLYL